MRSFVAWRPRRSVPLVPWMLASVAAVAALAVWDDRRESAAALDDFAREQATLAQAVALTARAQIDPAPDGAENEEARALLASVAPVARAGASVVLVRAPGRDEFLSTEGGAIDSPSVQRALDDGAPWVRLSRPDAAHLGLPARTALAGLATIVARDHRRWGLAVVTTAERERDREMRAQWRLALGLAVAAGLVAAFGGAALRTQRKELELARELAIAHAVEERDQRLARADRLAMLGALATGIAHEVSTPLGVILGRAEQLAPGLEGDERGSRAIAAIVEQGERINAIVRGFLRLARGDAPFLERAAPDALAAAAVALVEHRFARAGVTLTSDAPAALPRIACEPRLFEQVLVNLLLNACDASSFGDAVALRVAKDGERVTFTVTDEGSGISAADATRAIEPFFTTKAAGHGTGLGLAITSEIVKHHHGTLTIEPSPPKGTLARVVVPASPESGT